MHTLKSTKGFMHSEVTWTQPLPVVTTACCSTHQIRGSPPRKDCRSTLWQMTEWQQKYSEACTEQPGKEEWMTARDRNTSGSFKQWRKQQKGFSNKPGAQNLLSLEALVQFISSVSLKLQSLSWTQRCPSLLRYMHRHGEMRFRDSAGSRFKNSAREVSTSQFKHMQCLKNKRFLFGMQGPFKTQKRCYSHLFRVCPLPFRHPCWENSLPFFAASGKMLHIWLMGQKHLTPPTWGERLLLSWKLTLLWRMKRSTQLKKMLRSKIQGEVQETVKVWTVVEWA